MNAATREELQDLWRGINANHIAMELRAYRPGINFVGFTKGNIIDFLVRGECRQQPLSLDEAHEVATKAKGRQQIAALRRATEKVQELKQQQHEERLRGMRKQAQAIQQRVATTRGFISLGAEYEHIHARYMFTVSMHCTKFHEKLPALHEALPGFIFSAIPAQLVTIYCTAEQLDTVVDLLVEPWSKP